MNLNRSISVRLAALVLLVCAAAPGRADEKSLRLEIGDPARKDKRVPLVWDAITDTRSGELLSPAGLARRLADKRLVLVGESHTDINFHLAQLQVIEELHKTGRRVLIGLEMYPETKQEFLDAWTGGRYSEEEFLEQSEWYDTWGAHWHYYRGIFVFARDHRLPMYGLNIPREIISAVRKQGFDELSEAQRALMPPGVDTDNEEHYRLFRAFFEEEEDEFHASMSEEQWRAMFDAQCTWDATFGHHALQALKKHPEPEAVMVVLVGTGHVAYELGIQRQISNWSEIPMATVVPIPIREWDEEEPLGEVQASFADFVWGVPPETDPIYPTLGVSSTSRDRTNLQVIYVAPDSVAERAGLQVGDVLLEMDGQPLTDQATLRRLVAIKKWGDEAVVRLQRGEESLSIDVAFRRVLPETEDEEDDDGEDDRETR